MYLGFDEAGRGCVLGPLVLGMVMVTHRQIKTLKDIGVKDSKLLTVNGRQRLHSPIAEAVTAHGFTVIEAEAVGDERRNVNQLELVAMGNWIRQVRPKAVYVDVPAPPGKGLEHFCEMLAWHGGLPRSRVLGANKADQRFPIVSAASIMAKLHRDRLLEEAKELAGEDFGSGYPADPKTQAYLRGVVARGGDVPQWVRVKWETYRQLVAQQEQAHLFK